FYIGGGSDCPALLSNQGSNRAPSPDKVKGPVLRQALLLYLAVRETDNIKYNGSQRRTQIHSNFNILKKSRPIHTN
ncbi:hypothetical protein, partial [Aeromonas media]|uniref:hypothetical protein n=1 Tax=Aeromonas media TaxID=651 RepID=UPI002282E243